jgi:hypothetical protein
MRIIIQDNMDNNENEKTNLGYQFVPLPNDILELLLTNGLKMREWAFVLLVARLTYGCKYVKWAKIKFCDLGILNIGQSHAKEIVESVLAKKIVIRNEKTKKYQINEDYIRSELPKTVTSQREKLAKLVGKQLNSNTSQNGNENVTDLVTNAFPKEKDIDSQNGNYNLLPKQEDSNSDSDGFSSTKDILIDKYKQR